MLTGWVTTAIGGNGDTVVRSAKRSGYWQAHRKRGSAKKQPTVENFQNDPLFPRIERAVEAILAKGKVVAPVDVLIGMSLLTRENLEDWRRGRVPYLEKVINCNLVRLAGLLRILRFHAHDLNLIPSIMVYMRWGKGPKQHLRFTKTGDRKLEEAYARHFVWPGKGPFHRPVSREFEEADSNDTD